jgi:DNA-binding response OmpR family regulator
MGRETGPGDAGCLLVVEDDQRVAVSLQRGLRESGYSVQACGTLREATAWMERERPALVVLDLGLPDGDGVQWLRRLRAEGASLPVIILTARDTVHDRVSGLDGGADDYLAKPFAFQELLARIRARLRAARHDDDAAVLRTADLEVDRIERIARRGGRAVELTAREFDILAFLAVSAGRPVSRDMLTREVWKISSRATPMDPVIDVHISRLREKIDSGPGPRLIHTLRGIGFVLSEAPP